MGVGSLFEDKLHPVGADISGHVSKCDPEKTHGSLSSILYMKKQRTS